MIVIMIKKIIIIISWYSFTDPGWMDGRLCWPEVSNKHCNFVNFTSSKIEKLEDCRGDIDILC